MNNEKYSLTFYFYFLKIEINEQNKMKKWYYILEKFVNTGYNTIGLKNE